MSLERYSKLPVWLKPVPPLLLMGAFVAVSYGAHLEPFTAAEQAGTATATLPGGEDASGMSDFLFHAPTDGESKPPAAQPEGNAEAPPSLELYGTGSGDSSHPLQLSAESGGGKALHEFRNSPLAKTYGEALEAQKQGKMPQAIEGYRKVLHQMPGALPAHLNLAVAYLQTNQLDKAVPHLKTVAKADPNNVKVQFELAKVLLDLKRLGEAVEPLQRTIQLMPQNPQPRVLLAQLYYTQQNYQSAFDQWTKLDGIDVGGGQAAFAAGSIAAQHLKNPAKALPWLRKAHRLSPADANVTLLLAQVLASTGNNKEAEPLLAQIAAQVPRDVQLARTLAEVQWKNGHQDAAMATLQKVIALDPSDTKARAMLGEALDARAQRQEKAGQWQEASSTWAQVQQLFPTNPLPLLKRASIMRRLKRDDDAKVLYNQVLKTSPKDPNALLGLGGIAVNQKQYDSAYQNFWRAIEAAPELAPAYDGFVYAAVQTQQEKEAYVALQKWVKKHPGVSAAQKALKTLSPAANKLPELTPLDQSPDINTNRPPTLKIVPSQKEAPPASNPATTSTDSASARSRISPMKPEHQSTPTAPTPSPELSSP